ncbi:hypothetical protein EIN_152150 [Entamoeba invadens IP1]|uniref:Uncharacterized protein n=1 Tax=Entamoeba invadens IP1 TaxID=370355 RepID=A0A0A1UC21_ENTIV|nr:hypothetical protein EIN_152150 [Entamoeba invadens IP1]ELP91258.1 hypothetical protein EIN_152150 [Entamoeba invadens IP1]|eukprot:XP_004258029.1 hypothetical protein EIN_152150 [Entamoeba invadens IP1]
MSDNTMNPFETHSVVYDFVIALMDRFKEGKLVDKAIVVGQISSIVFSIIYLIYGVTIPIFHDMYFNDYYFNECFIIVLATFFAVLFQVVRIISSSLDNKSLSLKCSLIPILLYLVVTLISINSQRYVSSHGLLPPNNLVHVEYKYHCCGWTKQSLQYCGAVPKTEVTCFDRLVVSLDTFYKHNAVRSSILLVLEVVLWVSTYFFVNEDFIESQYNWDAHDN